MTKHKQFIITLLIFSPIITIFFYNVLLGSKGSDGLLEVVFSIYSIPIIFLCGLLTAGIRKALNRSPAFIIFPFLLPALAANLYFLSRLFANS